ncbi:hypothetical protein ABK040_012747 [Willaertia magna]
MSGYGTHGPPKDVDDDGNGLVDTPKQQSTFQKIIHNRIFNIVSALLLLVVLCASITCCIVVGVLHSHLLFQCGFAEFIFLLLLEGATLFFCAYHLYNIYKFFKSRAKLSGKSGLNAWIFACCSSEPVSRQRFDTDEMEDEESEEEDDDEEEEDAEESKFSKIIVIILKVLANALAVICFIVLVLFTCIVVPLQQSTYSNYQGTQAYKFTPVGTNRPTIKRESNGMVHIQADEDLDLYFTQGLSVAQDRLFQLEVHKRTVAGTLAEIVGKDAINSDKWFRLLGLKNSAQKTQQTLDQQTLAIVTSYVNGINSYINSNPPMAPEFALLKIKPTQWEVVDVLAYMKFIGVMLSQNADFEVLRYKMMQKGISKERIDELYPFITDSSMDKLNTHPTILSVDDLNLGGIPLEQRIQTEKDLQFDNAAFIPKKIYNVTSNDEQSVSSKTARVLNEMIQNIEPTTGFGVSIKSSLNSLLSLNPLERGKASNSWVIGKDLSATNNSLLCNDPHTGFSAPGIWYLTHLQSKTQNVIGSSLVGVPGIVIGKNDFISWGITSSEADVQDLFVMDETNDGKSYNYNGLVMNYDVRNETIKVKDDLDTFVVVKESVYGPVINEHFGIEGDRSLSLKWVLNEKDTTVSSILKINNAKNWNEFVDAVSYHTSPSLNHVYSDKNGNVGYQLSGLIPVRKYGHNGRFPVMGNGTWDWNGYIPVDKLPSVYNPTKGYVATANNRVTPVGYQYSISQDWSEVYRSDRIVQLIQDKVKEGKKLDAEYMKTMQLDVKSNLFEDFKFIFEEFPSVKNFSSPVEKWRVIMTKWDGKEILYSQEASIFELWYRTMGGIAKNETGVLWSLPTYLLNALHYEDYACITYHNKTCLEFAAESFDNAIEALESTYGSVPLWGSDIHEAEFPSAVFQGSILKCLAGASHMIVGGSSTVNVGPTNYPTLNTNGGVSYRQIIDWTGKNYFIIPLGQSGNFLSPFFSNFLDSWADPSGKYLDMLTTDYDARYVITVTPQA